MTISITPTDPLFTELQELRQQAAQYNVLVNTGALANWQQAVDVWRDEVRGWHPTPPPFECVAYLATEAAEALDRALRDQRPHDDRTNSHSKKATLGRELAQVIDMACTSASAYGIDLESELRDWFDVVRARRAIPYAVTQTFEVLHEDEADPMERLSSAE